MEEGGWVSRIRLAILLALIASVATLFLVTNFKGLSHEKGMEQAQIARQIAKGEGFSTKCLRPAALAQFEQNHIPVSTQAVPDTFHAPLNPIINAPFLWLARSRWEMTKNDIIYASDRIIASVAVLFFLLGILVNYFVVRRLFDRQIATFSIGFVLLSLKYWDFAVSGLPQMLMFFLFALCVYALVRAVDAHERNDTAWPWLVLSAVGFGVLALAHALTIWIFGGALLFVLLFLPKRGLHISLMVGAFLLIYTPWMVRNFEVCGSPFGVAPYCGLFQLRGTESEIMRSMPLTIGNLSPLHFRNKIQIQTIGQLSDIYQHLGSVLVAPVFFLALLHLFKRKLTSVFRWGILSMWVFALLGMSAFGLGDRGLQSNDLHLLFVPLLAAYGMAFVLVLWTRLEIHVRLLRIAFLVLLFVVSGAPLINELITKENARVQWPPYVPPYIAILSEWTAPNEIIMSDMPWAVAWYADRKSLWLPRSVNDYVTLNDYNQLNGAIVGLYLTPVTGNSAFIADIAKGEWKDWAPFITRNVVSKDFPLKVSTPLPIGGECIFYADRDRWSAKTD